MNISPSTMTMTMKYSSRVQHNDSKRESISDLFSSQLALHDSSDSLAESFRLEFPEIAWVDDDNAPVHPYSYCHEETTKGTGTLSSSRRKDVEGSSQNHQHKHMFRSLAVRKNLDSLDQE